MSVKRWSGSQINWWYVGITASADVEQTRQHKTEVAEDLFVLFRKIDGGKFCPFAKTIVGIYCLVVLLLQSGDPSDKSSKMHIYLTP